MMFQKTIQVGVIGTGGMGGRHARNLALRTPGAQVVAVMDVDERRAGEVAEICGSVRIFTDGVALIRDAEVEAVVIASPDSTHAPLALAAIEAGKATLLEKPLASNLSDAEQILRAEMASGRRLLQIGFMREYDAAHRQVKDALLGGAIGRPLLFRGLHTNLSSGAPRTIEDVIINSAIHDIHSARWLMADEVMQVYVEHIPAVSSDPESCRLALIQMSFAGGGMAVIEMNVDAGYGYEVAINVTAESGSIGADGLSSAIVRRQQSAAQAIDPDWLARFDLAYRTEAQTWIQSASQGAVTGPNTWDGYISMVIADACIRSARTGQPQKIEAMARPSLYDRE
ncbi:MAG: Gfo/Idh/MocA family oxidoreductase [Caldilineaceae bacterium]|nr:Gfo/Idh/MocA family oxidoreductase [Caldilineaceae bacterium]